MKSSDKFFFSCKYENEPADLKLLLIYFLRKLRYVLYLAIIGAVLFSVVYYFMNFVLVKEHDYVATGELYLVYSDEVRIENIYINDYTWQNLVHSDKVMYEAMRYIDSNLTEEQIKSAVTAGLVSDVRFVTLKVTTQNPDLSVEIAQAFQKALVTVCEEMADIQSVTVFTEADSAEEIVTDDRTVRMACTGAVIGSLLAAFCIVLQYVFDDSIYVPVQFERRFDIPVLGLCLRGKMAETNVENIVGQKKIRGSARIWNMQGIKMNYKVFTKDCKTIAVADTSMRGNADVAFEILKDAKEKLERDELLAIAMGELPKENEFYSSGEYQLFQTASINIDASVVEECAKADGVILLVRMGAHNAKLLERAVDLLIKQNCNIVGALLYDGEPSFLKMYYYDPLLFVNRERKDFSDEEEEYKSDDYSLL